MNNKIDDNDNDKCSYLADCPFLIQSKKEMPELAERLKKSYCMKNYCACARGVVAEAIGWHEVPDQMMPHQSIWAEQILTDAGMGSFIYNDRRKDVDKDPQNK